jgi:membrane protein DedA with SNARE-associated domain
MPTLDVIVTFIVSTICSFLKSFISYLVGVDVIAYEYEEWINHAAYRA